MNKKLEKEVKAFHQEKSKIFPSEMPSSWQMTSIIAEHFFNVGYKQALEDMAIVALGEKVKQGVDINKLDDSMKQIDSGSVINAVNENFKKFI